MLYVSFLTVSLVAEHYSSGLGLQDCERPLKERVVEAEKKLKAKEEVLKANDVELVAKAEGLKKARTKVVQLGGELPKLHEEVPSLKAQLDQAKTTVAKAVSKF